MSNLKETTELIVATNKTTNSTKQAIDSEGGVISKIGFFLDDIGAWEQAGKDLRFAQEAPTATLDSINVMFEEGEDELSAFDDETAGLIINVQKGLYSAYVLARKEAEKEKAEALAMGLKEGEAIGRQKLLNELVENGTFTQAQATNLA